MHEIPNSNKKLIVARLLLICGLSILLSFEGYFGYQLYQLSDQQEEIKEDYSNVNNISSGLFSIEQWRDKVSAIISRQIRDFTLTPKQKNELQKEVEKIVRTLIDKAEVLINKPKKTIDGKIKKFLFKTFVNTDDIKQKAPSFAKEIVDKVYNPTNKKHLSKIAMDKFDALERAEYLDSAGAATKAATDKVYKKYQVSTAEELNYKLISSLSHIRTATYNYSFAMLGCIVIVLGLWWIFRKRVELHGTLFIMSLMFAFILLFIGLTASMIEVDARIKALDFVLLGEHVIFENQVLFFQSKSILEVVKILISQSGIDSVLVGILILVFSILFPIMKLSATGIHLLSKREIAKNKIIRYFAFQSGKWSMADVIVIAILMVYIGLNGLLDSQLKSLNIKSDDLNVITTNNTALQPGFIIFISFVLYGLILSTILKFISPYEH
ncbi:paraquat-inducible protein A [Pedobacter hiemivivus]|uniref:Paraquat-inducible protein A n=1 Tax=Pedobacter hiemivivus TaxID=2530454 RepID=A0A4R0N0C6_9SPHI|nr:paraquat-inducible protein A [Pedobacter hiemivivus]TCC93065.1 paraquat-inducible protein A [Pedobacter hiemivivus]TKC62140.1 paraquat-inducible protein A [Pedobacter hiemivivus]